MNYHIYYSLYVGYWLPSITNWYFVHNLEQNPRGTSLRRDIETSMVSW